MSPILSDAHALRALVRGALDRPHAELHGFGCAPVEYEIGTPTTAGLFRVFGRAADGAAVVPWSLFVKVIQAWRHWELFAIMPPAMQAIGATAWRHEAVLYQSELGRLLPDGLRLPTLHHVQELGDDRLALWLEDVPTADVVWDRARFERAAGLLGRAAARLLRVHLRRGFAAEHELAFTRLYYQSRLLTGGLDALRPDEVWAHPSMVAAADPTLRDDVMELARRLPFLLRALDQLPEVGNHGDACPQNLLVPTDDPEGFVVIDWAMSGRDACGTDLAQLLVGLAHAGDLGAERLPEIHDAITAAYTAGLIAEGTAVTEAQVRFGFEVALVVRAAFTALPLERFAEPATDALADLVARRMRLTRYRKLSRRLRQVVASGSV